MATEPTDGGFTLLEALLALAILGGSLTAILTSLANHRAWHARSEIRLHLITAAEALLQRVGLDIPLMDGQVVGQHDDLQWVVVMRPHGINTDKSAEPRLYEVRATVSSKTIGEKMVLTTLRRVDR